MALRIPVISSIEGLGAAVRQRLAASSAAAALLGEQRQVEIVDVPVPAQASWALDAVQRRALEDAEFVLADAALGAQLLLAKDPFPPREALLTRVKWVQSTYAGVEPFFQQLALSKQPATPQFTLTRAGGIMPNAMAQYVFGWVVALERKFLEVQSYQQQHKYAREELQYRSFRQLTVGILGLGEIGQGIGRLMKAAGFRVVGFKRRTGEQDGHTFGDCADRVTSDLDDVLGVADFVVNVLPSTAATRGLLTLDKLRGRAGRVRDGAAAQGQSAVDPPGRAAHPARVGAESARRSGRRVRQEPGAAAERRAHVVPGRLGQREDGPQLSLRRPPEFSPLLLEIGGLILIHVAERHAHLIRGSAVFNTAEISVDPSCLVVTLEAVTIRLSPLASRTTATASRAPWSANLKCKGTKPTEGQEIADTVTTSNSTSEEEIVSLDKPWRIETFGSATACLVELLSGVLLSSACSPATRIADLVVGFSRADCSASRAATRGSAKLARGALTGRLDASSRAFNAATLASAARTCIALADGWGVLVSVAIADAQDAVGEGLDASLLELVLALHEDHG
ncbi:hypothetical protein ON010_g11864 [Phytophthora cinnamomi]|nr:hypothetical protein ON010_g11864 [Phytophthora cinnamomi]